MFITSWKPLFIIRAYLDLIIVVLSPCFPHYFDSLFYSFESSSLQRQLMVFYKSLCHIKFLQFSRTLLSILANLNNAVIWIVSIRPLISNSSISCTNLLGTEPRAPITIGITVTFMFHSFFSVLWQGRGIYLSFCFPSVLPQSPQCGRFSFSCWISLGLVVWPRLDDPFISQNPIEVYVSHFPGRILGCAYTIFSCG